MGARTKLNEIFLGGAVLASLVVGVMFQSLPLAIVFGGLLVALLTQSGDVRFQAAKSRRR